MLMRSCVNGACRASMQAPCCAPKQRCRGAWPSPCTVPAPSTGSHAGTARAQLRSGKAHATAEGSRSSTMVSEDEPSYDASEYTVVLDRPTGLTLAPDSLGQVVIIDIEEGSPAAACELIQVGDVVARCSVPGRQDQKHGANGEQVWRSVDVRRLRWALDAGANQVRFVMLRARATWPVWYNSSRANRQQACTLEPLTPADPQQPQQQQQGQQQHLPSTMPLVTGWGWPSAGAGQGVSLRQRATPGQGFGEGAGMGGWLDGQVGAAGPGLRAGAVMEGGDASQDVAAPAPRFAAERASGPSQAQPQPAPAPAPPRLRKLQRLRHELLLATTQPALDLDTEVAKLMDRPGYSAQTASPCSAASRRSSDGSRQEGSAAGSSQANVSSGGKRKKVVPFLPWLLVTTTRMDTRDLTGLASARGLGALLELSLSASSSGGHLIVKGSEDAASSVEVDVSSMNPVRANNKPLVPASPLRPITATGGKDGSSIAGGGSGNGGGSGKGAGNGNGNGAAIARQSDSSGNSTAGASAAASSGSSNSASAASATSAASGAAPAASGDGGDSGASAPLNGEGEGGEDNGNDCHPSDSEQQASEAQALDASGAHGKGLNGAVQHDYAVEARHLIGAAACLQRLVYRRQGSCLHPSRRARCAVLLHCDDDVTSKTGNLLAAWLHWYCHMPLQEAVLATETALGSVVQQALLEEATEQLLRQGEERRGRVVLRWRHSARSVSVVGDIVGGWHNSLPMVRCNSPFGGRGSQSRGHFFLPLKGLEPGVYFYKFIVDGTWAVDPFAPKATDNYGNYNNLCEVHSHPPPVTSVDKLRLARRQAALLALDGKMRRAVSAT